MADTENGYLSGFSYTGHMKDGSEVKGKPLLFRDQEARESIRELEESRSRQRTVVVLATDWQGDEAPYTYDFGPDYAGKNIIVGFNRTDGSDGQLVAAQSAGLAGGTGTVMYATNEKPVVDLPLILQIL